VATGLYPQTKVLSKNFDVPNAHTLAVARPRGAYASLEKALRTLTPAQVTEEVKKSRLRGRGGAGFPTGMKWSFVAKNTGKPTYLVMNADESEPGAFKDRYLMERDPHLVVEGALVSAYAIEASAVFIYVRGEYPHSIRRLEGAIAEARAAGLVGKDILGSKFSCEVWVHPGAGAYICGEETGLLESLEGKRGHPRIKPPFPAVEGVFRCPTIINNVETLSHVPWIVANGGEAFAKQGIPPDPANPRSNGSTGTKLMGVSGQVRNPGLWEFEPGITLRELVYGYGGGPLPGRKIKAVIPGGVSMPVLLDSELDVKMGFDELVKVGSGLGTGTAIVMDDATGGLRQHRALLRPRVVRPVHTVPRGLPLDGEGLPPRRRRRRPGERPRPPRVPVQGHRGPHDLLPRGRGRLARAQHRPEVPRGVPREDDPGPDAGGA
jgi:NADH-quinone oxidoreductase subunit F